MITVNGLIKVLKRNFKEFSEFRQLSKVRYNLRDILLDGFKLFFYEYSSLSNYSRSKLLLGQERNGNNLLGSSCFIGLTQFRSVLDRLPSKIFNYVFNGLFRILQRGGHLKKFEFLDNKYLCAIDGTTNFSSNKIYCEHCLTKNYANKENNINYQHQVLQGYICHPDRKEILPLMPEAIINADGQLKQDCELNAAKRLIKNLRKNHPKFDLVITGDSLYSCNPLISLLEDDRLSFILMCKPSNHKYLFENLAGFKVLKEVEEVTYSDEEGIHHYEWFNDIELNGQEDAKKVNFFSYILKSHSGDILYKASWVTDIVVNDKNITRLVKAGRSRWKSENEGFNSLKNQGYHMKHNFGHGKNNLCFNLYLLNLLAFLVHQILLFKVKAYQQCYIRWKNRATVWEKIKNYLDIKIFRNWDELFQVVLDPDILVRGQPP